MKKKIVSVEEFIPEKSQKIIFDTNILINLFYPINFSANNSLNKGCDELYSKILNKKSSLLITSIQLSEFINRCIRIEYNLYKEQCGRKKLDYKKDYRSTNEYKEKMDGILDIVKSDIVSNFQFVDDGFSKMLKEEIFLYEFSYDFNDALLFSIVKQQNAIFVTNDHDFINYGTQISIVTNNKLLLNIH